MKSIIIMVLLAVLFFSCKQQVTGKVIAVHDGDTFTMLSNEHKIIVRLSEIDAPELAQDYGRQAKEYLSSLILDKEIIAQVQDKDKYGRTVCETYCNGVWINEQMVANGYAYVYKRYGSRKLYNEESEARYKKIGLWSKSSEPPFIFRKNHKN